jgi:hypothetical protein
MGMTIDEAIGIITAKGNYSYTVIENKAKDVLVDTARKYQMMQAEYENRLKADLKAMLVELQMEIREHDPGCGWEGYADKNVIDCIIQERINSLKGE